MAKHKPTPADFGYKSLTLRATTVTKLAKAFDQFQKASGSPNKNYPVMSDFLDLALTLIGTPKAKWPRLILVSKNRHRTVLFDTKVWRPVVLSTSRKGDLGSTRIEDLELYKAFTLSANRQMFRKVSTK